MAASATISAAQVAEVRKIIHEMDKPQKRTIRAAEFLSVKESLPKTFVNHTIIHENPSQGRLLGMELDRISHRKANFLSTHEISRRTFLEQQTRTQRKWKSQDELRISQMNFPTLRSSAASKHSAATVDVMYKSPRYNDGETKAADTMLPYMQLRRERTEFIRHRGTISTTRLPTVIEIDALKLQRYNTFCGQDFKRVKSRRIQRDRKFVNLISSLSPNKTDDKENDVRLSSRADTKSVDNTRPWYMSDSGSDSEDDVMPVLRGMSRDAKRKSTVVFPTVAPRSNVIQDKYTYAVPVTTALTTGRRPSVDRAQTQYNTSRPLQQYDSVTSMTSQLPKTAPDMSNGVSTERLISPSKVVDLTNAIITELGDDPQSPKQQMKSILKTSRKSKKPKDNNITDKRDKIKRDLRSKDLRELMEKYGHLKPSAKHQTRALTPPAHTMASHPLQDPREQTTFLSPTLERRFHVKSGAKKF